MLALLGSTRGRKASLCGGLALELLPRVLSRSTATGELLKFYDVPLGSMLEIDCGNAPVDVLVSNGGEQDLRVGLRGNKVGARVREKLDDTASSLSRTWYSVQLLGDDNCSAESRGTLIAEVPPRYFGVWVKTGGNVRMEGAIKEAHRVAIHTRGGDISLVSNVSAESLLLSSGGGDVHASQIMAKKSTVDTRRAAEECPGRSRESGAVRIDKVSCIEFDVDAPGAHVHVESLNSSKAAVCGSNMGIGNVNTLDGEASFNIRGGDNETGIRLDGVDGIVALHDGGLASRVEVQLNKNASHVDFRTTESTEIVLYAHPALSIETPTSVIDRETEDGDRRICRLSGVQEGMAIFRRSWREMLMERLRRKG
jgi:hypothetical protein